VADAAAVRHWVVEAFERDGCAGVGPRGQGTPIEVDEAVAWGPHATMFRATAHLPRGNQDVMLVAYLPPEFDWRASAAGQRAEETDVGRTIQRLSREAQDLRAPPFLLSYGATRCEYLGLPETQLARRARGGYVWLLERPDRMLANFAQTYAVPTEKPVFLLFSDALDALRRARRAGVALGALLPHHFMVLSRWDAPAQRLRYQLVVAGMESASASRTGTPAEGRAFRDVVEVFEGLWSWGKFPAFRNAVNDLDTLIERMHVTALARDFIDRAHELWTERVFPAYVRGEGVYIPTAAGGGRPPSSGEEGSSMTAWQPEAWQDEPTPEIMGAPSLSPPVTLS